MTASQRHLRPDIDAKALRQFLDRSRGQLAQIQALLVQQSPLVDVRSLLSMTQFSREIAIGAELANLTTLARAADQVEWLAADLLGHPGTDPIGFTARMGERLCALEAQLTLAIATE
jgi:acetate kinase